MSGNPSTITRTVELPNFTVEFSLSQRGAVAVLLEKAPSKDKELEFLDQTYNWALFALASGRDPFDLIGKTVYDYEPKFGLITHELTLPTPPAYLDSPLDDATLNGLCSYFQEDLLIPLRVPSENRRIILESILAYNAHMIALAKHEPLRPRGSHLKLVVNN